MISGILIGLGVLAVVAVVVVIGLVVVVANGIEKNGFH